MRYHKDEKDVNQDWKVWWDEHREFDFWALRLSHLGVVQKIQEESEKAWIASETLHT